MISDAPERAQALVYFASYPFLVPVIGQDVSNFNGALLSVAGAEDMVSDSVETRDGYNAFPNTSCKAWFYIEGLGHAGFGDYSHPTQALGSISRTDATATLRHLLVSFLEDQLKGDVQGYQQFTTPTNYPNTIGDFENSCMVTSIEEFEKEEVLGMLYPNPTNEVLQISTSKNTVQVTITNYLGQGVFNGQLQNNTIIDVENWSNGIYFVVFQDGLKRQTIKFVKY